MPDIPYFKPRIHCYFIFLLHLICVPVICVVKFSDYPTRIFFFPVSPNTNAFQLLLNTALEVQVLGILLIFLTQWPRDIKIHDYIAFWKKIPLNSGQFRISTKHIRSLRFCLSEREMKIGFISTDQILQFTLDNQRVCIHLDTG